MAGSTTARGYGAAHQAERAKWAPLVAQEIIACARCLRLILAGQPWDLDHDGTRTGYLGPSHRKCNRRAGAVRSNKSPLRRRRRIIPRWNY